MWRRRRGPSNTHISTRRLSSLLCPQYIHNPQVLLAQEKRIDSKSGAQMAYMGIALGGAATARAFTVRAAAKSAGGGSEEPKGFLDWFVGALNKDQLLETDAVLQKVEEKSSGTSGTGSRRGTSSVSIPSNGNGKKKFGGPFAKN